MRRAFFFIVAVCLATSSFASIPRASALDVSSPSFDALSETRIRVFDVVAPFARPVPTPLNRALHQAYAELSTTNASGLAGFLSVDPVLDVKRAIRQPQAWNRYSYVVNNPINRVDPDGRVDQNWDGGMAQQLFPGDRAAQAEWEQGVAEGTAKGAAVILSALIPDPSDLLVGTAALALGRRLLIRAAAFGRGADDTMQFIFDTQRQKGNFGLGSMALEKADKIGRAWVGDGAKALMRDGKQVGLISEDGSKVYRFASKKAKSGRYQANLEEVTTSATGKRTVVRNAHIDVEQ